MERGRNSVRLLAEKLNGLSDAWTSQAITRVEYQSRLIVGNTTGIARESAPIPPDSPKQPVPPAPDGND